MDTQPTSIDSSARIEAALARARESNVAALTAWAEGLPDDADVARELTALVLRQVSETRDTTIVEYELYLAALRRPALQPLALNWSTVMTTVLERFVDANTADALSALYDGLLMRVLISGRKLPGEDVEQVFRRVTAADRGHGVGKGARKSGRSKLGSG